MGFSKNLRIVKCSAEHRSLQFSAPAFPGLGHPDSKVNAMAPATSDLYFQAAVERPLSVVFRSADGSWEGHDYRVEVVTERKGLDALDVVMDFRDLEAALDHQLAPLNGRLLSDAGLRGPVDLAQKILEALAPKVPAPARLAEVALTDGRGYRVAVKPSR
jgi:hypothetical protein